MVRREQNIISEPITIEDIYKLFQNSQEQADRRAAESKAEADRLMAEFKAEAALLAGERQISY